MNIHPDLRLSFIIKPSGEFIYYDTTWRNLYDGLGCRLSCTGYIVNHILTPLAQRFKCHFLGCNRDNPMVTSQQTLDELEKLFPRFLFPSYSYGGIYKAPRNFKVPQSDTTAQYGIDYWYRFSKTFAAPYSQKIDKFFWRGAGRNKLRRVIAEKLLYRNDCDVKIYLPSGHPQETEYWAINPPINQGVLTSKMVPIDDYFQYKYNFIIDGHSIASACELCFASGCTPINIGTWKYLLLYYAEPWVHYVPISYDLSDLEENMDKAKSQGEKIARAAYKLARQILTPTFLYKQTAFNVEQALIENNLI